LDYNRDGHEDLYICNDATPNMLLINDGHGHFHDEAMKRGVAFNALGEAAGSMTAAIGDCNGDGTPTSWSRAWDTAHCTSARSRAIASIG
jgi:hypothetical protein